MLSIKDKTTYLRLNGVPLTKVYWKDYLKAKDYDKDINHMCRDCINEQKKQYGEITIECNGLAKAPELYDKDGNLILNEEERFIANQLFSPYFWAKNNIDSKKFKPRWYQEMMVNCTAKRVSYRCGRRAGKALYVNTKIPTKNGLKLMLDIKVGDQVFGPDGKLTNVIGITNVEYGKTCYEVYFNNNDKIIADKNHLWTFDLLDRNNQYCGNYTKTTEDIMKLLKDYKVIIKNNVSVDYELEFKYKISPEELACILAKKYYYKKDLPMNRFAYSYIKSSIQSEIFPTRQIPYEYLYGSIETRKKIALWLLKIDGVYNKKNEYTITTQDEQYRDNLKQLFSSLGIVVEFKQNYNEKKKCLNHIIFLKDINIIDDQLIIGEYNKSIEIVEIVKSNSYPVKCIEVDNNSRMYLASESFIPTHNSYSLALKLVHRATMVKGTKILIATPYESQAKELIDTSLDLIRSLKEEYATYDEIVQRYIRTPNHTIYFMNTSVVKAFTTGSSGAGPIRGQSADVLILDEIDFMSKNDLNSIVAILADNPDVELWAASTPYRFNLQKLEDQSSYKSFHFPSCVLPHYSDELEKELKEHLSSDIGYIQEVLAEYGESSITVFQHQFIEQSLRKDIDREDVLKNRNNYIITLGCDWNDDRNGTRILIVAFDKISKKFFVVEKRLVSKIGWTQVAATHKIIELNRKYNCDYLYVDEGYGVSNIQFIKQYAIDQYGRVDVNHPDLNLENIVGVNFSSNIEILDNTGVVVAKKNTKVYLVENAVNFLEKDLLRFDPEYDKDLIEQAKYYILLHRTPSGRPVYGTSSDEVGDHDLDAFMIALFGWSREHSHFLTQQENDNLDIKFIKREHIEKENTLSDDDILFFLPSRNRIFKEKNKVINKKRKHPRIISKRTYNLNLNRIL